MIRMYAPGRYRDVLDLYRLGREGNDSPHKVKNRKGLPGNPLLLEVVRGSLSNKENSAEEGKGKGVIVMSSSLLRHVPDVNHAQP
jgi:hypothetical protein